MLAAQTWDEYVMTTFFFTSFNNRFLLVFVFFQRSLLQQSSEAILGALTCGSGQHFSDNPAVLNFFFYESTKQEFSTDAGMGNVLT